MAKQCPVQSNDYTYAKVRHFKTKINEIVFHYLAKVYDSPTTIENFSYAIYANGPIIRTTQPSSHASHSAIDVISNLGYHLLELSRSLSLYI